MPPRPDFLLYLARRIDSLPVTMVVAMRRGEAPHEIRFAQLLSQDAAQMLSLEPLSVDASSMVVRGALGPRADEALCRSCHEATQGNPFYLRELAAALKAEGGRPTVGLAQRVRALGIDAIATNVLLRLARLGTDCERLAEALAVLGAGACVASRGDAGLAGPRPRRASRRRDARRRPVGNRLGADVRAPDRQRGDLLAATCGPAGSSARVGRPPPGG